MGKPLLTALDRLAIAGSTLPHRMEREDACANLDPKGKGKDGRENHTSIPIHDDEEDSTNLLATSIWKEMEELHKIPPECCIYRVPPLLRKLNERVYTPQVVSIGPFHHDKKELQGMEEHKLRYMKVFLSRTNTSFNDFITAIKGMEKKARNYYAEKIILTVDEFVKVLLVDSLFIIEAITGVIKRDIDGTIYLPHEVFLFQTDIILLENQIPFFVLNDLFRLAFPNYQPTTFLRCSISYLRHMVLIKEGNNLFRKVKEYLDLGFEIKHFVDLLRICHLPSTLRTPLTDIVDLVSIPNAVQLKEVGIKLKFGSSDCLLDIKYTKGVLEVPLLVVEEYSEIVLSNILVLENCHYLNDSYIRDYVFFMQMLVDTTKDADLLIQNGIIEDWTGESSTVAALFNKVGHDVLINSKSYYFYNISKKLNTYCNVTRHKWKATFKRDYCSTPWMITSTMAAVILLILTLLSTIAAFLAL